MIAALLVAITAAGGPSPSTGAQDPPIRIWMNNDRHFERGDRAKVQVETDDDGYVVVLHADPDGRVRVLFPLDPGDDNFVRGGHRYEIRGRGNRESFTVETSSGGGTVFAAVSHDPFRFDEFVQGDHWDYRSLNATRLGDDPEPDLTDMVKRMSASRFDYDLLSYDVSYGRSVSYYSPAPVVVRRSYYDPFCDFSWDCDPYYLGGRSGPSVNLIFGRPYRSYYYDPFSYDPFYYGGYYSGYNYRRSYNYPTYYPYGGGYGYNNYYPRSTYQGQIYTPYQFKSINRTWNGGSTASLYRTRRNDDPRQATQRVYQPPLNSPKAGTPSRPDIVAQPGRDNAVDARRQRVEGSRGSDGVKSRPAERSAEPQSRGEGRRVDAPRGEQRTRQDQRGRRLDMMPETARPEQQGRFEQVRPDMPAKRDYREVEAVRAYPAKPDYRSRQEAQPQEVAAPREQRQPKQEFRPQEYRPQIDRSAREQPREQQREQPRMAPPPREESPRAAAPREYSRPSESNRKR